MIADLKPYRAYKDSEIDWLAKVPAGWSVQRLKHTSEPLVNGIWGNDPDGAHDITCVRVADFDRERFVVRLPIPTQRAVRPKERHGRMLSKGDLLLEKSGGGEQQSVGAVVEYTGSAPAVSSNFVARIRPRDGFLSRYLAYLHATLYASGINVRSIKQTTGIQNLDGRAYLSETVPLPPFEVQAAIVRYLDHVDSRIQPLMAAKEQLIELLEEEKQSIIHRAVTRGLDTVVALKPSGIDWLGEIPQHWEVRRLKSICSMRAGEGITVDLIEESGSVPVYGGNGLRGYTDRHTHDGDFVLVGRQGALCGNVHRVRGGFWASEHAVVVTPLASTDLDWLGLLLVGMDLNQYSLSAAQPGLSVDRVRNLGVGVPLVAEQSAIAARVRELIRRHVRVIEMAQRESRLLREYRARLISDVVTGKLDVREAAAKLPDDPDADDPATDEVLEEITA